MSACKVASQWNLGSGCDFTDAQLIGPMPICTCCYVDVCGFLAPHEAGRVAIAAPQRNNGFLARRSSLAGKTSFVATCLGQRGGFARKSRLSYDPTWPGGMQMIHFADGDDDADYVLMRYTHDADDALMRYRHDADDAPMRHDVDNAPNVHDADDALMRYGHDV